MAVDANPIDLDAVTTIRFDPSTRQVVLIFADASVPTLVRDEQARHLIARVALRWIAAIEGTTLHPSLR